MALIFIALVLLALAWPLVAVGAVVLVILAVLALRGDQLLRDRSRALTRAGGLLTVGAALTAIAAYGHGLAATTFGLMTDADDRCALKRPEGYDYRHGAPAGGSHSMWPLHDTTCGPDLVPGFVNPLVAGSVVLFVALAMIMTLMRVKSR
ncbi:hypothetical protein F6X68_04735 [Micromonospora sp. AMSO12t]|uniref:hypothetical protein n=1 Tax=unclassified Micromonospora TaxID=2617518 RepID=UPI00124B2605|nr:MULTISPECIES: hypothetical protein [unclassified Micromonospora]KAB1161417.1 hypothetical protein F6X68_04735 [Micromonospora sp. AMSO12t]WSF99758.1 hypothetical protein OG989_18820 [Micromonospora sp. NBC_01740]